MSKNSIQLSTIKLVSQFEGLSLHSYHDSGKKWAIGYGADYDLNGSPVTVSTPPITLQQADQLLAKQLQTYAAAVNAAINNTALTQNQFNACVSLCYNIGTGGFSESSVAKFIIDGNFQAAASAFLLWDKSGGQVNPVLLNRRKAEMAVFLS